MKNRIVVLMTLGSFLVFCWSCYSVQEIKPDVLATAKPGEYEIRKIEKISGETIEYPDELPGRVGQGQITGTGMLTVALKSVEVDSAGLVIISKPGEALLDVKTQNGRIYKRVKDIEKHGDKSILHILELDLHELSSLPVLFTDIQKAWIPKYDTSGRTFFYILAAPLLMIIIIAIISGGPHIGWGSSTHWGHYYFERF